MTLKTDAPFLSKVISEIIDNQRYGVEYQPILDTESQQIFGYEALARFYDTKGNSLSPQLVFSALHRLPEKFYAVEYLIKELQIQRAPEKKYLFLNLDPDAYAAQEEVDGEHPFVTLLSQRENIIMEIIENTSINDAAISMQMMQAFQEKNISVALDDIGTPESMLSFPIFLSVDFLKFDKIWLKMLSQNNYKILLESLLACARKTGQKTILEGIEQEEDLQIARDLGFDFVQGFLFRPLFINTSLS